MYCQRDEVVFEILFQFSILINLLFLGEDWVKRRTDQIMSDVLIRSNILFEIHVSPKANMTYVLSRKNIYAESLSFSSFTS